MMGSSTWLLAVALSLVASSAVAAEPHNERVFQWNIVEYEWPNQTVKDEAISSGMYKPQNSAINGIKLYNKRVFVTVPRLKEGVPSTLNEIVTSSGGSHVLRPYPSWDMQTIGDCAALQNVQSMEIDLEAGHMWIVDTGYRNKSALVQPIDVCLPKIIIYDIVNNREIHRYTFPKLTVGYGLFYLNDVVLSYHNGSARYAFISDTLDYKLVVYDYRMDTSYTYTHPSMQADQQYENITIANMTITGLITGINGIAMSPDFRYVYYSSVAGVGIYQIETSVLTSSQGNSGAFAAAVRHLGNKEWPGDGMAYGAKHNLYYSSLGNNAVYKWDIRHDLTDVDGNLDTVQLTTTSIVHTDDDLEWVDTLCLAEDGYLWFTTSKLVKFFSQDGITATEPNFIVWKVFVNDYNYMDKTWNEQTQGASGLCAYPFLLLVCLILSKGFEA